MIDPRVPRWLTASIYKHFDALKTNGTVFIEGMERDGRSAKDLFELRLDGPKIEEYAVNDARLYIDVNILVQATLDRADRYRIHSLVGTVVALYTDIPVFQYGDGDAAFGCLQLQSQRQGGNILVSHLGQIDLKTAITQSVVTGQYVFMYEGVN
jgi:hypothetical protein